MEEFKMKFDEAEKNHANTNRKCRQLVKKEANKTMGKSIKYKSILMDQRMCKFELFKDVDI